MGRKRHRQPKRRAEQRAFGKPSPILTPLKADLAISPPTSLRAARPLSFSLPPFIGQMCEKPDPTTTVGQTSVLRHLRPAYQSVGGAPDVSEW